MSKTEKSTEVTVADAQKNTVILAEQLGYKGSLTIGALEDEIRFYQGRTIEACLELGKRLLILKEMTPQGEFQKRVDVMGFSPRMAQKFMQAVLKLSKTNSDSLLKAAGNQTKLLELVTLDDDDLEALQNGDSVGDITLDDIETMSVRELKNALRDARSDSEAKDQLLADKNKKIDSLDKKLTKQKTPNAKAKAKAQALEQAHADLQQGSSNLLVAVNDYLVNIANLQDQLEDHPELAEQIDMAVNFDFQRIADIATQSNIAIDFEEKVTPSWMATAPQEVGKENDETE